MQVLNDIVGFFTGTLNTVAWLYIFLPFAVVGGLYLTIRTGAVQFRRFGYAMKNTVGKMFRKTEAGKGAVTPLQAVTTALAATVGTGNIVGTSQAIALGGYGAVFWLWLAALVGMCTKYSEVTLAVKYRERDDKGDWVGGPMYYIKNGLGKSWGWLAVLFCVFTVFASFGIGNMSQVNSVTGSVIGAVRSFTEVSEQTAVTLRWVLGVVLAVLIGVILIGGIKRIGQVTEKLIPFMSVLYILFTLVVIFGNVGEIGHAFGLIFSNAFTPRAVGGAASGIMLKETIVWGLRRSAFSNEAGLGSAAIAHAASSETNPVRQGLYGIFEVFADTIVICTLTALTVIVSGVPIEFGVKPGSELIVSAFSTVFGGKIAALFVALALMLFAFSTVLGWALYGARCVQFLFGTKAIRWYQVIFVLVAVVGCVTSVDVVWDISDTFNGLMAIPNFIAVFGLSGVVAKLTREYFRKKK
ncbi:MAG: sodium:alanine symporter family protein [Oscillospiraceae bacterium]|nr:sodium:alanine symporter family protein [Oscillospiraceae bacterium]